MRVVAGRFRGRVLLAPKGRALRPTADRVREALFNRLAHAGWGDDNGGVVPGAHVLDAFAGTGALGIEALSRGAADIAFIDNDPAARAIVARNLKGMNAERQARIVNADVLEPPPAPVACGLILMDPPYGTDLAAAALIALRHRGWVAPGAIAALEVAAKQAFDPPAGFTVIDSRRYGAARLIFLTAA
ncbi:MAG: 16S rRNA (guanine(966)-N(2))-methyltransferase RsmD [Alphaproteobacteria bacterium]|nr:16S rRNA (guanine(966)-N(2))-methyltransferase RsmD [Alphaproteobacteria bacterium]